MLGLKDDGPAVTERKAIIGLNDPLSEWAGASRQDGVNFRTNMVTLAEYQDRYASGSGNVLALSTAWACVRLIAGTISSLPLAVYETEGESRKAAKQHPLYRVLHDSPNADQTALNFWQYMSAALELHGNAFAEVVRASNGRVIALLPPLAPDCVRVRRLDSGAIEYEVNQDRRARKIRQEDMLHIRGFGGGPLGGLSTLSYGARAFGMAQTIEHAAAATFRNGMRPSVALETDKPLTPEQRKLAESILEEKFQGAMNSGRPFLADNGLKVKNISFNPEDAQMLESRAFSVAEICRFFSVPPHMIGHTEKSTSWGSGIEQMTLAFVQFSLRERLKNIESTLEKTLLTEVERQRGMRIEFNLEGLLRGDSAGRASFYQSGLSNGWLTINEVRQKENLPPVEGGDVPRMQMQNVPITDAASGLEG